MDNYWRIIEWPTCQFHVFLSHVREDTEALIKPLDEELRRRQIIAWGDWKLANTPLDSLEMFREKVLQSRHIVYLVTPHVLKQGRGWMAAERAYAAHLQSQLSIAGFQAACVEKLILMIEKSNQSLSESIWHPLIHRSETAYIGKKSGNQLVLDCADQIQQFLRSQEQDGPSRLDAIQQDPMLRHQMQLTQTLENRISCSDPQPRP